MLFAIIDLLKPLIHKQDTQDKLLGENKLQNVQFNFGSQFWCLGLIFWFSQSYCNLILFEKIKLK